MVFMLHEAIILELFTVIIILLFLLEFNFASFNNLCVRKTTGEIGLVYQILAKLQIESLSNFS